MIKSAFRWSASCLVLGLIACKSDPTLVEISSSQAALTASENSERALDGVLDAADFLSESTSVAQTLSLMGGSESCGSTAGCTSNGCSPVETVCTSDPIDEADLEEARADLKESAHKLVQRLRERILIPANLEGETSTSATYRLGPEVWCEDDTEPQAPGSASPPSYDSDCVEQANKLQPRLRLTSPAEGDVDVALLLGAQRNEPLVFELHRHSLGLKLNLGEALDTAREFGEDAEAIEKLSGVLELELVENDARDYSLDLNVLQAVEAVLDSDGERLSVSIGATSPALQLRLDGNARRLLASMDLGSLRVLGPLRLFADSFGGHDDVVDSADSFAAPAPASSEVHGAVEMFLAGLQGSLEYVADSDQLKLNGLGFGDKTSFIKNDGQTLASLDLNSALGRHVNLVLEPEGDGTKISISPGFDLKLALAFQHIADQVQGIQAQLLNDTWHFWFDGDQPAIVASDDQLAVQAGTLHLESSADPSANLEVSAGMCLVEADSESSSEEGDWRHRLNADVCQ
ncbi:MAG TPA: hypothetical protein VFS67_01840 [Polyangiaceae bacterium]|nr:hypothetical protein [Polyangiaceae bacterium]